MMFLSGAVLQQVTGAKNQLCFVSLYLWKQITTVAYSSSTSLYTEWTLSIICNKYVWYILIGKII